jgi:hypothetical protein
LVCLASEVGGQSWLGLSEQVLMDGLPVYAAAGIGISALK